MTDGNKPKTVIIFLQSGPKGCKYYLEYKKFDEKAQTAKFTVFARGNLLLEHRFSVLKCGENLSLQSHPEKFYIGFFAQIFFGSLYASIGLRKKFWEKKSM